MNPECESPLGKVFGNLAKAYADAYTERLKDLPIDRYFYALVIIDTYSGELSQTTLAEELMIDKATVVRMLDYLEKNECILRKPHPNDRRAHLLDLTPKALKMIPQIKKGIADTNAVCLDIAKRKGFDTFFELMEEMGSVLHSKGKGDFKIHFVRKDADE